MELCCTADNAFIRLNSQEPSISQWTAMSSYLITALFGYSGSDIHVIRHSWTLSFVMRSTLGCVWIEIIVDDINLLCFPYGQWLLVHLMVKPKELYDVLTHHHCQKKPLSVYVTLIRNGLCYLFFHTSFL